MKTVVVNRFDGGMVNDPRSTASNVCRTCQHFDVFTDPHRLIPHYAAEAGDSSASTQQIRNFAFDGTTLYGLGRETSAGINSFIYSRTAFTTGTWTALKNTQREIINSNNSSVDNFPFFIYYRKTAKLYGAGGGRYFWSYAPGTDTLANTAYDATSYTTVSNAIVHSKDDILYVGMDNKIIKNNNDSWSVGLTLPSVYVIVSICEYGDFVAVGCRHKGTGNSRVFIWNRDETTTTLSQSIDWEQGALMLLEELEGFLVGVSFEGIANWDATTNSSNVGQSRTIFRYYAGSGGALKFSEFTGFGQTPTIQATPYKTKTRHRILFPASITIAGDTNNQVAAKKGIWAITKTPNGFAVVEEYIYLNNTPDNGTQYGLIQIGDYLFASYVDNSTHYTDKTDNTVVYTQDSTYESTINPNMDSVDRFRKKQLKAVIVITEKLTSGQQVVVKYKVDGGSFDTVFTKTSSSPDADLIGYESGVASSSQFTAGREYEFQIISSNGAIVTGLGYAYDILPNLI